MAHLGWGHGITPKRVWHPNISTGGQREVEHIAQAIQTNGRDKTRDEKKCVRDVLIINGGCGSRSVRWIVDGGQPAERIVDYGHTYHALRAYGQAPKNKKPPRRKKLTDDDTHKTQETPSETWELCTLAQACTGDEGPSFCEPWCHPHPHPHPSTTHPYLSTTLWPSSLFSRDMGRCIGTGQDRFRGLLFIPRRTIRRRKGSSS